MNLGAESVKAVIRVRSLPALPAAKHRGRVWEPFQGSHHNRPSPPPFEKPNSDRSRKLVGNQSMVNNAG
jgi:hypothetical protein